MPSGKYLIEQFNISYVNCIFSTKPGIALFHNNNKHGCFDFRKKKWSYDPIREEKISRSQTTFFPHLNKLTGTVIPSRIVDWLCHTFGVASVAVVKSEKDGKTLGDFTLIFAPGKTMQHQKTMELYANLTGMLITRIETEIKLHQKNERLLLAVDAGEQGFWDWHLENGDIFYSPRYFTMPGYHEKELPMCIETFSSLIHPKDQKKVVPAIQKHVERGETYQMEFRMQCKDGTYKWISAQGKSFLKDHDGKPYRAVGLHVDIDQICYCLKSIGSMFQ